MAQVTRKEIEYKNYGRCLEIANGLVKVIVTLDIGPRIINYSFADGENIFFEDLERQFVSEGPEFEKFGGGKWYIYGGHRMWVSPEDMPRSYYPDNEPVRYELIENGAHFMPNPQKWNQYVFEISVQLAPDSTNVTVTHKVTNLAAWPVELAPWAISVLSPNGKEIVPQPTKTTGLLNNRLLALWPYTKMTDPRVRWGDKFISLRQDPAYTDSFKYGLNSEHGCAMYFNHGDLFVNRFSVKENGVYPDGGMSFETYTNPLFLEMESLGELVKLAPQESTEHIENWSLYKESAPDECDEEKLQELVDRYVR